MLRVQAIGAFCTVAVCLVSLHDGTCGRPSSAGRCPGTAGRCLAGIARQGWHPPRCAAARRRLQGREASGAGAKAMGRGVSGTPIQQLHTDVPRTSCSRTQPADQGTSGGLCISLEPDQPRICLGHWCWPHPSVRRSRGHEGCQHHPQSAGSLAPGGADPSHAPHGMAAQGPQAPLPPPLPPRTAGGRPPVAAWQRCHCHCCGRPWRMPGCCCGPRAALRHRALPGRRCCKPALLPTLAGVIVRNAVAFDSTILSAAAAA